MTYIIEIKFHGCPYPVKFPVSAPNEATARYQARRIALKTWGKVPVKNEVFCEVHP